MSLTAPEHPTSPEPGRVNVPIVNITIPVFNRHAETLKTIELVRNNSPAQTLITVVDNHSKPPLREALVRLHQDGVVDHLFLLDDNYGVSCACNVGWKLVDAPFFMKLDNDIHIQAPQWLETIFSLWGREKYSTVFGPVWNGGAERLRVSTPHGVYWKMPLSVSGAAFLVSKKVRETMGYFSEDYGLYGEEDADYCMRCHHAGIRKYTFEANGLLQHLDVNTDYAEMQFDKVQIRNVNVNRGEREGIFALNLFMYEHGLRDLRVGALYDIADISGYAVKLAENTFYRTYLDALRECCTLFNRADRKPTTEVMDAIQALPKCVFFQ